MYNRFLLSFIFVTFQYASVLANNELVKDHSNVAQFFYYDSLGNEKIDTCPDKMIFNETLRRCVKFVTVKRSKRQKVNPGESGCRYNEQCSAVWPGATCTPSNACQCPNGQPPSRTNDGPVCNNAGSCPTNGQYSKLKDADGVDVRCSFGGLFFDLCPDDALDYECLCTPPSSSATIACTNSISFCCPSRALACIMPKEEGSSNGALPQNRFFYNSATNECETLSYNGIGGNANNFNTKQQCESYCKTACPRGRPLYIAPTSLDDTLQIGTIQTCTSSTTSTCGSSDYYCNAGDTRQTNSNNYCCPSAKFVCKLQFGGQVARTGIAQQPSPNVGKAVPNLPARTRYYYDDGTQTCKTFQYLGAGGDYNNFASESECLSYCSTSVCDVGDVLRDSNLNPIACSPTVSCPGRYGCVNNRCCPSKEFICSLPMAVGSCTSVSRKWWFNPDTRTCQEFSYNGCQGNFNKFDTFNACQTYCGTSEAVPKCPQGVAYKDSSSNIYTVCSGTSTTSVSNCPTGYYCNYDGIRYGCCPSKSQTCEVEGTIVPVSTICITPVSRWYYNATSRQCAQFIYNGCDGNSNNFATQLDCQDYCGVGGCKEGGGEPFKETNGQFRICTLTGNECLNGYSCTQVATLTSNLNNFCCPTRESVCRLQRDEGSACGMSSLNRFYFNSVTRVCESFTYRGCGGNRNNFASATQCQTYCSSAACASGQIALTDPLTSRLVTCQTSTTTTSSSGCTSGYTCVLSTLLNQGVCCGSNAPIGTCPPGQSAFIDSFTSTPMQCLQNTDGQCPLTPNRYTCQPSFTSGSNFCCATVVVQCSRGGRVGTDLNGNPSQCTPNIPNNCASGYECQPVTFPTGDFTSATGYCCGTPNPCGQGFNTLFSNSQPVTCDANSVVNTCFDARYTCRRTDDGQGYCCISSVNAVNPCAATGKNPYYIQNAPTVCIPGSGNTGAGCPVGYTCDLYDLYRTNYCCTTSGVTPTPGASTCPSGTSLSTSCSVNANCGTGFVCKPGSGSAVCCPSPSSACSQPQSVGQPCTTATPSQRYSFNPSTRSCTAFTYSGCGANSNNFFSAQACEEFCMPALCARGRPQYVTGGFVQTCATAAQCNPGFQCTNSQFGGGSSICCQMSTTVCNSPMDVGRICTNLNVIPMQMWYFSSVTRTCQQFGFNGCGGNSNNFETQSECLTFCGGQNLQNPCPSPSTAQINPGTSQPLTCLSATCGVGFQCTFSQTANNYYCCSRATTGRSNGCSSGSAFLYPGTNSPLACTPGGSRCPNNYACVRSTSFTGFQCCSSTVVQQTLQAATMPVIRCTSNAFCQSRLKSMKAVCNLKSFMCSCDSSETFANNACGAKMSG